MDGPEVPAPSWRELVVASSLTAPGAFRRVIPTVLGLIYALAAMIVWPHQMRFEVGS